MASRPYGRRFRRGGIRRIKSTAEAWVDMLAACSDPNYDKYDESVWADYQNDERWIEENTK